MQGRTITALVVVQILFGLFPVAAKFAFQGFSPVSVLALRALAAAVVLYAVSQVVAKRKVDMRADGGAVVLLSFLGIIVNQALFLLGVQWTTAINAIIIITTIPVWTYIMAVLAGKESLGPRRALGIALALAGALWLLGASRFETGLRSFLGDLMVLVNCISFSAFLVWSKPYAERYNSLSFTAWLFIIAAIVTLPVSLALGLTLDIQTADPPAWWALAFVLIGPTIITYTLNNTALSKVPSSTVGVFIYLQPVFATLAAGWFLGERLTWVLAPAAICIFGGVGIVLWRNAAVAADVSASAES